MDKWCKQLLAGRVNGGSGQAVSPGHVRASALYDHSYITLASRLLGHPAAPQNSSLTASALL